MNRQKCEFIASPYDLDAESALIGSLLLRPEIIPGAMKLVSPKDCYKGAHKHILEAVYNLKGTSNVITLKDELIRMGKLDQVGGPDYLLSLCESVSTSAGMEHCARIIRRHSVRRKIIEECQKTEERCFQPGEENESILSEHKSAIRKILSENENRVRSNPELANIVWDAINEKRKSGNPNVGPLSGLKNIDSHLYGFRPGTVTVLGAESGMGKSALALNIMDHAALNYRGIAPYFTHESTDVLLMLRRFARHARINLTRLSTGNLHGTDEDERLTYAYNLISGDGNLLLVEDSRFMDVQQLTAYCETLALEQSISMICIDYIQLMNAPGSHQSRHHEISFISRTIAKLAKDVNCPILLISQLGKDVERRQNREPMLSDLKESGDIRNDAHNIIFLYGEEESDYTEVICKKGKDTGTWRTQLRFHRDIQRFEDCEERNENCRKRERGFER
jgi:replicative DNA helicase